MPRCRNSFFVRTKEKIARAKDKAVETLTERQQGARERGGKRRVDEVDASETEGSGCHDRGNYARKTPRVESCSRIGVGPSTIASRKLNQSVDDGSFVPNEKRWSTFEAKIREIDKDAEFYPLSDPRRVRHSLCGNKYLMKEPYHIGYFESHANKCKGPSKTAKLASQATRTLDQMAQKFSWGGSSGARAESSSSQPSLRAENKHISRICPGLTAADDSRITIYLDRSPASGGGGPMPDALAATMFPGKPFTSLSDKQKQEVRAGQRLQFVWRNEGDLGKVYSTSCENNMKCRTRDPISPCKSCKALLKNSLFQKALGKAPPDKKNLKYTPKHWRDDKAAAKWGYITGLKPIMEAYEKDPKSPCLLYASGVVNGDFKEDEIFTGLVEAMVTSKDKKKRGVGMQGFKYAPGVAEFAHIINIHSPRAYQAIRNVLHLPTERSHQINRARQPRFPIGITEETFDQVARHLETLKYSGPLGLSCDDTQLLPALRPYYDGKKKQHYLLGGTGEPMLLAEPEKFAEIVKEGKINKATKMRLWCLQVPMPNIPTIVVAAMAIPNTLTAEDLYDYLKILLDGLLRRNLKIVAYASDGSAIERSLQRLVEESAKDRKTFVIKHPAQGPDITISIPLFGDQKQPIVMIQDSLHGAKTYRNNGFSGARLLVLGNYVATYEHFRRLGTEDGPLFVRDVHKLDRQDDNAATRLFSGDALEWLTSNYPELLGPSIYLFVFGELVDAYQNRHITLVERLEMAFRAYFFMEMWEQFLEKAGYSKAKHFISKEACDITRTLIHGLIKLVIVYRELPESYPVLFWLLSTEICEHIFGLCRQIIQDFTLLDFHYMVPKLFIRLREAALFGHCSDGKERANGYNHTYGDMRGINLVALSTFPSDDEINGAAKRAYQQAENLWFLLGAPPTNGPSSESNVKLPTVDSWFTENTPKAAASGSVSTTVPDEPLDSDYESDIGSVLDPPMEESDTAQIQLKLDELETAQFSSFKEEDKVNNLAFAVIALSVQDSIAIHELPEPDEAATLKTLADESGLIGHALAECLPPIDAPDEPRRARDASPSELLNFNSIVALRRAHERKQAKSGVRKRFRNNESQDAATDRQKLLREFEAIIKEQEERGVSATVGRSIRWQPGRNPTTSAVPPAMTGNALNAAESASAQAKKLLTKRVNAMRKYKLPTELETARVSALTPLFSRDEKRGSAFGFILCDGCVMLGQLLSVYSKTGGKNGKHAWVETASSISSVSYLPMQVFEHAHNQVFRVVPLALRLLSVNRFTLLPGTSFLCTLDAPPVRIGDNIQVTEADYRRFQILAKHKQQIVLAVKALNGRKKSVTLDIDGDEED